LAKAEEAYNQAIAIEPTFTEAHFNLGILRYKELNPSATLDSLKCALDAKPDFEIARFFMGTLYAQSGDNDIATKHFARLKRGVNGYNSYEDSWQYVTE
jgi:tetratricopeptide (TPR) repeat protein